MNKLLYVIKMKTIVCVCDNKITADHLVHCSPAVTDCGWGGGGGWGGGVTLR